MIKDIDISHYYKKFIEASNDDIAKYNKELELTNKMKEDCRTYIKSKNQVIKDDLNINLNDYGFQFLIDDIELIDKLERVVNNALSYTVGERRIVLLQLFRYCDLAKKAKDYITALKLATRRSELSYSDYRKYIHTYYNYGVHKCVLEGYAYHFKYEIGDLTINFWRYRDKPRDTYVDWNATRIKKQEIIDAGLKPYNKEEAEIYKIRGIKYDGIPYVVYKTNKEFYEIQLINNGTHSYSAIKFKYANYVNTELRGKDAKQLNSECKTVDDIFKLKLGLRSKLLVYLERDPSATFKYIRNVEQQKYERGAHNSKNRQRFQS